MNRMYRLEIRWISSLLPGGQHDPRIHDRITDTKNVEKIGENGGRIYGDIELLINSLLFASFFLYFAKFFDCLFF